MKGLKRRLDAVEKQLNPLTILRRDIKRINDIMRELNYQHRFNNNDSQWFTMTKEQAILQGSRQVKDIIISLAAKYSQEVKDGR